MSLPSFVNHFGIRKRVMLLALVPITVITVAMSVYMISSRLNLERDTLFKNSQTLLSYLSAGAEFGLFADNSEALAGLAKAPQEQSEISDIIFINADQEEVFRSSNIDIDRLPLEPPGSKSESNIPHQFNQFWAFQAPVRVSGININDFGEENQQDLASTEPIHLGWVVLLVNDKKMKKRQFEILTRGLIITLIGLSLTLWMAMSIGRSITGPIQAIIDTVDRLSHEQLDARVKIESSGEIGELEKGINSLASRVQQTRIRLEEDIAEATKNLRSTLRTLERKNIDLDQEKQRAEAANVAKDEFLARMSHELRTPLTSVMGFIQLLEKTQLSLEQKEYSSIVRRTSSLLLRLIDDILDFSKLQSNAIKIEQIPFSLEECIEDSLEMQAPIADNKGLELYFICDPKLPLQVIGDPTRIRQVIANLIGNAVKFTKEGSITIGTQCVLDNDGINVELTIKDTGIGIEAEKLESLFQPFSQADTSITRRFGGSGLGLVITKHLVELMGGSISLHSKPGEGTEVVLKLPFDHCDQPNPPVDLSGCRVLLFDRNPVAEKALSNCLLKWQSKITAVNNHKQFLKQLKNANHKYDAVIVGFPNLHLNHHYQSRLLGCIRQRFSGKLILVTGQKSVLESDVFALKMAELHGYDLQPIENLQRPLTHRKLLTALKYEKPLLATQTTSVSEKIASDSLQDLKLLIAEDNSFNRLLLQKILEQAGAQPTLVSNGEQALAQAGQGYYDCILMDVHMPVMDGIEASRHIRQLPEPLNQIPIIALTANVIANEEQALKEAGVATTLFKPINEQKIIHHIQLATKVDGKDIVAIDTAKKPRLADYGISLNDLHKELDRQISAIAHAFELQDTLTMRDHAHQLTGLAGLLDLVELEAVTMSFGQAVKTAKWRDIWENLWRLQRVIAALEV